MLCGCLKLLGIMVAVLAVFLAVAPGLLGPWLDSWLDEDGSYRTKGLFPFTHTGVPFGFELDELPDLKGKVCLITGGNVGLGFSTAKHLLAKRASVTIACRSARKCQEAKRRLLLQSPGGDVRTLSLDLSSFASVRAAARVFLGDNTRLDSLVLNAGVMQAPYSLSPDGIELQMAVNHFGHFLLTRLLLPLLEATAQPAAPSTVVAVASSAHFNPYPEGVRLTLEALNDPASYHPRLAYGQSKLANVLFARELSGRVLDKNVLVNAVHPGAVATDIARHLLARLAEYPVLGPALEAFFERVLRPLVLERLLWSADEGALTQVFAAFSPRLRAGRITGRYFHPVARETDVDPLAKDRAMQAGLWELSERVTASPPE